MKIFHNPRCRKSRETLGLLIDKGYSPEIILYLENPPSEKELKAILKKLKLPATQLIRRGEKIFKSLFQNREFTENEWVRIMVDHPILIERPIVVNGNKAILGRPPERVLDIL